MIQSDFQVPEALIPTQCTFSQRDKNLFVSGWKQGSSPYTIHTIMMIIPLFVRPKGSHDHFQKIYALLDTGAYRTTMTKEKFLELGIQKTGELEHQICSFGNDSSTKTNLFLGEIEALQVNRRISTFPIAAVDKLVGDLSYTLPYFSEEDKITLGNYSFLDEPDFSEFNGKVDMVIGIDLIHVVRRNPADTTLRNGLVLSKTIFGPVVSGSYITELNEPKVAGTKYSCAAPKVMDRQENRETQLEKEGGLAAGQSLDL